MGELLVGPQDALCLPETCSDDPATQVAALVYTSGTTGSPKGVMLTHRNLLYIAKVSSTLRRLGGGDRVYGVLPIAHVYGLASACLGTLFAGACLQLEARYSPEAMLRALADDGITAMQGVPSMYVKLLDLVRSSGRKIAAPRLRFLYAGGSPLDPALKAGVEHAFGLPLHNGYGLTESSPTISQTRLEAPRQRLLGGHHVARSGNPPVDAADARRRPRATRASSGCGARTSCAATIAILELTARK